MHSPLETNWPPASELLEAFSGLPGLALLLVDQEYRIRWANTCTFMITGFGQDRIVKLDFLSLFDPTDRERLSDLLVSRPSGQSSRMHLATSEGRRVPVVLSWATLPSGTWTWFALLDMQEYVSMEKEEVQVANDRAEKIAEMGDMGILIYDQDFRIAFANQVACQILGQSRHSILANQITSFLRGIQRLQLKHLHLASQDVPRGRFRMEVPIERPDGTTKLAEMCLSFTADTSGRSCTYAYLRDLTERIQMENELRKANEFLHNVIRSSVDGIIAADMKGNIIIFNEGAERLLGYKAEEVVGKIHITQLYPSRCSQKNNEKTEE